MNFDAHFAFDTREEHKMTDAFPEERHAHGGTPNDVRLFPAPSVVPEPNISSSNNSIIGSHRNSTTSSIRIASSTPQDCVYEEGLARADYLEYLMHQRMLRAPNKEAASSAPQSTLKVLDKRMNNMTTTTSLYDWHYLLAAKNDRRTKPEPLRVHQLLQPRLHQDEGCRYMPGASARHIHLDESNWNLDLSMPTFNAMEMAFVPTHRDTEALSCDQRIHQDDMTEVEDDEGVFEMDI